MSVALPESAKPSDAWSILIIEDSPEDAAEIRRMLLNGSDRRYKFSTFEKGADGVREALLSPPNCLILDYTLPDMTAEEVLASLCGPGGLPKCPVVVLTGRASPGLGRTMLEAGAQDYIGKDWSGPPSLTRAIENSVERWEMLIRLRSQERLAKLNWLRLSEAVHSAAAYVFEWDERIETIVRPQSAVPGIPANPDSPETMDRFLERIHPEDRQQFKNRILLASEFGADYINSFRFIRPDGELRHLEDRGHFEADSDEGSPRLMGISTDVTDRIKLQDQLRQSQKMEAVGHLAGGIAHDFNNLLTVINGYSECMIPMLPAEGMLHDSVEAILEAGEQAAALTRQLLAFGRRSIVVPKVVDLNVETDTAMRMLRRMMGGAIRLETNLADKPCKVFIDPNLYQQILINLAVNARDAMPDGGTITISISYKFITASADSVDGPPKAFACVTVKDNGPGMTPEIRNQIFDPFFTTKEVGKGTGLGLSVVDGIVRQFDGEISVDSAPGRGTTFEICFPLIDQSERTSYASPKKPIAADGGSETVLVVEDEPGIRNLLRAALISKGYDVLVAATSIEAQDIVDSHLERIDLLLADLVQADLSIIELTDRIRKKWPVLKTIYISGQNEEIISHNGVNPSRDSFLRKPFTLTDLTLKIRHTIDSL